MTAGETGSGAGGARGRCGVSRPHVVNVSPASCHASPLHPHAVRTAVKASPHPVPSLVASGTDRRRFCPQELSESSTGYTVIERELPAGVEAGGIAAAKVKNRENQERA